jgi:hypothetical protein
MMSSMSPGSPGVKASAAKWSAAAVLAVAAGALLWLAASGAAEDGPSGASGAAGSNGVLIVTGPAVTGAPGLYLVDTRSQTMCVYQWVQARNKPQGMMELRLMAARNYGFDLQLDDYNNDKETSPGEVRKLVEQQRRLRSSTQPN